MSSVRGLNARPQMAIVRPVKLAAEMLVDLVEQDRLLLRVHLVDRVQHRAARCRASRAIAASARTSFGKQLPP